jgi:hypothetical protein
MTGAEVPVLLTQKPNTVAIKSVTPTTVEVVNLTDQPIGYIIVVTRKSVLQLASAPWRQYLEALKTPVGRETLLEKFNQYLNRQLGE